MVNPKLLASAMVVGACAAVAGCAGSREQPREGASAVHRVELLCFEGCPGALVLQRSVRSAVDRLGDSWRFSIVDQEMLPPGDLRRGYGSPSVLVDGREIFGERSTGGEALSCRIYPDGIPDAEAVYRALRAAVEGR